MTLFGADWAHATAQERSVARSIQLRALRTHSWPEVVANAWYNYRSAKLRKWTDDEVVAFASWYEADEAATPNAW